MAPQLCSMLVSALGPGAGARPAAARHAVPSHLHVPAFFGRVREQASRSLAPPRAAPRGEGGEQEQSLRETARALDKLFYQTEESASVDVSAGTPEAPHPGDAVLPNLPLWRVQWAVLPGAVEVLHVHVPHYTSLFSRLLEGPAPRRFGHVYLPGGSVNLGAPEYALAPGTQAPLVGTLMEVLQAVKFPDGRLLVLAAACGKFRVTRATQALPFGRADVALAPDAEEVQAQEALALGGLESVAGDVGLMAAMEGADTAARHAAAAASQVWLDYELSEHRVIERLAVIDGADEETALEFGRRLVAMGAQAVLPLPYHRAEGSAAAGGPSSSAASAAATEAAAGGAQQQYSPEAQYSQDAADLRDVAAAAQEAARAAALHTLQRLTGRGDVALPPEVEAPPGGALLGGGSDADVNSTSARGIPSQSPGEVLGADPAIDPELPDSLESALTHEAQVWQEIGTINALAAKLGMRQLTLPSGIGCLRPRGAPGSSPDAPAANSEEAHQEYPSLRRAQRLSFSLASVLSDVTADEGRQALLEARSTTARLRLLLARLRKHRNVLAALLAVEDSL